MAVPRRVSDGDFSRILETGNDISFPFSNRGDGESFEYDVKCEIDKNSFRKESLGTKRNFPLGAAYLVEHGNCNDNGSGCFLYNKTYASIPKTRTEGETVSWSITLLDTIGASGLETNITAITTADVVYEYFLNSKPQPIIAPRWYYINSFMWYRRLIIQDSEVGIYKGPIYYRKTYYANTAGIVAFLGAVPVFPVPEPP